MVVNYPSSGKAPTNVMPRGGAQARVTARVGGVDAMGVLVSARQLGLHRFLDYDENHTIIGVGQEAPVFPANPIYAIGGLDGGSNFTSVPANVVSEGCQWLLLAHDGPPGNPMNLIITVEGCL